MQKSELLSWLHEEYQQWEVFLDQIGPERMEQPGVAGDWSIKDIVAHLTGWQPKLISGLQAAPFSARSATSRPTSRPGPTHSPPGGCVSSGSNTWQHTHSCR